MSDTFEEIQSAPAGAAFQIGRVGRTDALLPNVVEYPCPFGIDPQIDVLRHYVADGFGTVLGVFHLVDEVVGAQTHAEVGIGLDPHFRVVPLRFIVERVDDAEQ